MGKINRYLRLALCLPIKGYRYWISPLIKPCCRYYPSCSQYALGAIMQYGIVQGIGMACKRLLRCHPWAEGGYDPLPPNNEKN